MHAAGAAHLGHPADGLLHFLGGHQHQVGQLVDDHHHLGHGVHPLGLGGLGVVGGQVPDPHLGEHPVTLHHLGHRPLQGAGRLLGVGDHRDEQMWDTVVDAQLHHLGVHHDEADLLGAGLIEQRDDEGVGAHRLTRAGGAGDEQMGQLGDVAHDALAPDVLAHGEGHLAGAVLELLGAEDGADVHWGDQLVGHLDAHHGDLPRDGGDAHPRGPQGQGDVVGQVGELIEAHPLVQLQFIPGDRGPPSDVDDVGVDAEGVDGVGEPLLVGVELHQGLPSQFPLPLLEQVQRGVVVGGRLLGHSRLNVLRHLLGGLLRLLLLTLGTLGDGGLPDDLRHEGRRCLHRGGDRRRGGGLSRGIGGDGIGLLRLRLRGLGD